MLVVVLEPEMGSKWVHELVYTLEDWLGCGSEMGLEPALVVAKDVELVLVMVLVMVDELGLV